MGAVPHLSWRGPGLLLALLGWSLANLGGGPYGCTFPPILAQPCCGLWRAGSSLIVAEGPVGAFPRHSGLAEGHVGAIPRQSWLSLVLAFMGWVVPRQSWRRALWLQFPINQGWGLVPSLVGWTLANPGGGPCGCSSTPILAAASCWCWWGGQALWCVCVCVCVCVCTRADAFFCPPRMAGVSKVACFCQPAFLPPTRVPACFAVSVGWCRAPCVLYGVVRALRVCGNH